MRITWLGHSGFRIETEGTVLLIDPWLTGNPSFPENRRAEAVAGAENLLLSHGHGDHASNALSVARETGATILCVHELAQRWAEEDGVAVTGFGKGGTVEAGTARVTMVNAAHSSSLDFEGGAYAGGEAGFVIRAEGRSIYFSGDTDVMADMGVIAERYAPDIGILCCGGHYTMDMEGAAWAAKRFFDFRTVIPCHYATFPILAQSAQPLVDALPEIDVRLPEVMVPFTL
jgi:L-ascorbate metabolism protein UlaG (beta-lactamase superfamily)